MKGRSCLPNDPMIIVCICFGAFWICKMLSYGRHTINFRIFLFHVRGGCSLTVLLFFPKLVGTCCCTPSVCLSVVINVTAFSCGIQEYLDKSHQTANLTRKRAMYCLFSNHFEDINSGSNIPTAYIPKVMEMKNSILTCSSLRSSKYDIISNVK